MLYVLMGKSATGKDTIFRRLMKLPELNLKKIVPYTTRPMRHGEIDGQEYHFVDETAMSKLDSEGKIAESRCYNTVHGNWYYFTADDGTNIKDGSARYITIGTLEAYTKLRDYYGQKYVTPIYVYVDDFERMKRSLCREKKQSAPSVAEVCRRFLADENDFSEELLEAAGVNIFFENIHIDTCVDAIKHMILSN